MRLLNCYRLRHPAQQEERELEIKTNCALLLLGVFALWPGRLAAQELEATRNPPADAAWHHVSQSCHAEATRFCPRTADASTPREEAICLKFYRTSLSPGCRGAINAVTR